MQFADPVKKDFALKSFKVFTQVFLLDDLNEIRLGADVWNSLLFGKVTKLEYVRLGDIKKINILRIRKKWLDIVRIKLQVIYSINKDM